MRVTLVTFSLLLALVPLRAEALSLKVSPLEYRTQLARGEKKKGFVDVGNPTKEKVIVRTSVQRFSQTDNNGSLRFYNDEQVSAGVRPDLDEFELGPRQSVRMFFLLDGTKLPTGDVFAALFFTLRPKEVRTGVAQSIRLGTLLSVVNGTPGARKASVSSLKTPWLHVGDTLSGSYTLKNTDDPAANTGFYPKVNLSVSPFGESRQQTTKLVFAGRSRENDFTLRAPYFGFYQVHVGFGTSQQSQLVFVARPLALIILAAIALLSYGVLRTYRRRRAQATNQKSTSDTISKD